MNTESIDLEQAIEQLEARKTKLTVRKDRLQAELELVDFQLTAIDETLDWARNDEGLTS